MANTLQEANRIYKEVLEKFPYCSATAFHLLEGRKTNPNFGGSCILQSKELFERYQNLGIGQNKFLYKN